MKLENIFEKNDYPGRGIIIGSSPTEEILISYFITGRSENSRNRVFELKNGDLFTSPSDIRKVKDPSLIIYRAIANIEKKDEKTIIVTNGDQTDTILEYIKSGKRFEDALLMREYEPDEPNWTPRISACVTIKNGKITYKMGILKRKSATDPACVREFYDYDAKKGKGHMIHTYSANTSPLTSFADKPIDIEINDTECVSDVIWNRLSEENRISLFMQIIDKKGKDKSIKIVNKYEKVTL